ncbi:MAG TPA: hypothetical protein VFS39_12465 [Nitrospira sp.]|nr:hypothetical protein [Nitrospira sp.]
MARRDTEWFNDPVHLVLVAGTLSEATVAETVLTEQGIDYTISLDLFRNESVLGAVFGGTYHGLFFYVPERVHRLACLTLEEAGLKDIVPLNDEEAI